ncbi:MAG: FAD-dependent monooxygenase [Myxococcota bacterium]
MIETEVAIVGSGVAGLALAALLRMRGIDYVVLDRRRSASRHDRGLALGETIPPSALPMLQQLGLLGAFEAAAIQQTYGYQWSWGSKRLESNHFFGRPGSSHGLKLDKPRLLGELGKLGEGSRVHYDTGLLVHEEPDGVALEAQREGQTVRLRTAWVVDATGRHRVVARQLGGKSRRFDELLAFSCHLPRVEQPRLVHGVYTEAFEHGWGLVSSIDEKTLVLSVFTDRHSPVRRQLKCYAAWPSILTGTTRLREFAAAYITPYVVGCDAASTRLETPCGTRWIAIGDAAFTLDPLSSHGVTTAVYSAKRAAQAIEARRAGQGSKTFAGYGRSMTRIFSSCLDAKVQRYRAEQRWIGTPFWERAHSSGRTTAP